MRPEVGCSNPAISLRHVVLPEPDGPSMAKNSPGTTSRSTSSMARAGPKWRETFWRDTADAIIPLSARDSEGGTIARPQLRPLLSAHHADIVADPAGIRHALVVLRFALLRGVLPEGDLVEIVEAVGGAAGVGQQLACLAG